MRTLQLAGSSLAFAAAFAAYGCALDVSGLPESTSNTGGTGPTSSSVGPGGGATSTGNTVTSATSTTGAGCVSAPEVCNDGKDNDCDGMIDCADAMDCTTPVDGSACVAPAPGGWTVVSFTPDAAAACPAGFGSPVIVASAPASPSMACTCNCGPPLTNPCLKGTLNIQLGYSACAGPNYNPMVTGACNMLSQSAVDDVYATARANVLAPMLQVTCDATGAPADASPSGGVICAPSSDAGAGCANGEVCLPKVGSSSICIQKTGDVMCPAGPYSNRHVVAAPADVVDERKCDGCSCKSTATSCTGAKLTGYDDAACTKHPVTVDIDGTCNFTPTGVTFKDNKYFIYNATPNTLSCALSGNTPMATGGFKVNKPTTVCCL